MNGNGSLLVGVNLVISRYILQPWQYVHQINLLSGVKYKDPAQCRYVVNNQRMFRHSGNCSDPSKGRSHVSSHDYLKREAGLRAVIRDWERSDIIILIIIVTFSSCNRCHLPVLDERVHHFLAIRTRVSSSPLFYRNKQAVNHLPLTP